MSDLDDLKVRIDDFRNDLLEMRHAMTEWIAALEKMEENPRA